MRPAVNPFRTGRLHQIPFEFAGCDLSTLISRLASLEYRGCIVGPHGTGKTLLLDTVGAELSRLGYSCVRHSFEHSATVQNVRNAANRESVFLLDGADSLGRLDWQRVRMILRHARGLIVTSHERVLLPEIYRCSSSPELLEKLVSNLAPRSLQPSPEQLAELLRLHRGNIRSVFLALYDRAQSA